MKSVGQSQPSAQHVFSLVDCLKSLHPPLSPPESINELVLLALIFLVGCNSDSSRQVRVNEGWILIADQIRIEGWTMIEGWIMIEGWTMMAWWPVS